MPEDIKPYDPIAYSGWILPVGISCLVFCLLIVCLILWLTRRKPPRSINTLKPVAPVLPNIPALQQKYLALIAELESAHSVGTISHRDVHQKLSILLRLFVHEARGYRAPVLTLAELREIDLPSVVEAIDSYYRPEFDRVKHGSADEAIARAKGVISSWS